MDIYSILVITVILIILIFIGIFIKRDITLNKDFDKILLEQKELLKSMAGKISELKEQNRLLLNSNEIYKEEIYKLESEAIIQTQKKMIVLDNSDRYREIINEKDSKITSLEKHIGVLKNKNFYKVSFEKAEKEIEELKNKIRILEKSIEARRQEVLKLKKIKK